MSHPHPIIAITGSSAAGTSNVRVVLEHICRRRGYRPAYIDGDGFHRYERTEMEALEAEADASGGKLSHFGPEGNQWERLEALFQEYGDQGTGERRFYIHNDREAAHYGRPIGTFTDWEPLPPTTDVLFYEGLHGGIVTETVNVARQVDLLIGVTPIVNLEWIERIHRDTHERGTSRAAATQTILRRMHDYVHYITPQFSLTDVNFQRVPTVDTANPFTVRDAPTPDESFVVIRFRNPETSQVDFPYLLSMLNGSFMSRRNTLVAPGGKLGFALEIILQPLIDELMRRRVG